MIWNQHAACLGVLDLINCNPEGNVIIQSYWWNWEKTWKKHEGHYKLEAAFPTEPAKRLFARASELRHLLQHNWEICSSCIPNWNIADGKDICLMKYVHSIKLGHWGFRTSIQSHCYPSPLETREVSGMFQRFLQTWIKGRRGNNASGGV